MVRTIRFALALCMFTCLLSCTKEEDQQLIGKWINDAGTWDLEFRRDNTGKFRGEEFTYEITRDKYKPYTYISASVKSTGRNYRLFDATRNDNSLQFYGFSRFTRNNPLWFKKVSD